MRWLKVMLLSMTTAMAAHGLVTKTVIGKDAGWYGDRSVHVEERRHRGEHHDVRGAGRLDQDAGP